MEEQRSVKGGRRGDASCISRAAVWQICVEVLVPCASPGAPSSKWACSFALIAVVAIGVELVEHWLLGYTGGRRVGE